MSRNRYTPEMDAYILKYYNRRRFIHHRAVNRRVAQNFSEKFGMPVTRNMIIARWHRLNPGEPEIMNVRACKRCMVAVPRPAEYCAKCCRVITGLPELPPRGVPSMPVLKFLREEGA